MLENKRIIVTGAARGMGEATVLAYVSAGAQVVAMDINDAAGAAARAGAGPGSASSRRKRPRTPPRSRRPPRTPRRRKRPRYHRPKCS